VSAIMTVLSRMVMLAPLFPALALAVTDAELQERALEKIRERHPSATCAWWNAQGSRMPRVIEQMLESPERMVDRFRLIEGLGCFTDEESVKKVRETAEKADSSVLRMTAVRATARGGAPGTAEWLRGFLAHEDPRTRVAAADALQLTGDARAPGWIDEQAKTEKEAWVARKLKKAASVLPKTPGGMPVVVLPPRSERLRSDSDGQQEAQARLEKRWSGGWSGVRLLRPEKGSSLSPRAVAVRIDIEFKDHRARARFEAAGDIKTRKSLPAAELSEVQVVGGGFTAIFRDRDRVKELAPELRVPGRWEALRLSGELRGSGELPPALLFEVAGIGDKSEPQFWLLLRE